MAIERTMEGGPRAYRPTDGFFDEVFAPDGAPRPHAAGLVSALERLGPEQLAAAGRNRDKIFLQQGITFELTDEDGPVDRPWPLDLVPRILPASEWTHIERGLAQRIRALNQFLDDLYHEREIVRDGSCRGRSSSRAATSRAPCTASGRRAASTATSPAATWCATRTGRGRCSRTTSARRPGSPTCSRTASR